MLWISRVEIQFPNKLLNAKLLGKTPSSQGGLETPNFTPAAIVIFELTTDQRPHFYTFLGIKGGGLLGCGTKLKFFHKQYWRLQAIARRIRTLGTTMQIP